MMAALFYWTGAASWTVCGLLALWLAAKYLHIRVTEARRVRAIRQRALARLHEMRRVQENADAQNEAKRRAARVEAHHDTPVNQWLG